MRIPRSFHRIWLGAKPLPVEFQQFGLTWEHLHPGWAMQLWTDANLPPLINQRAFDGAPSFAAKADILRYEILLLHGGVYVDTDFECLRSIEPLIEGIDCFVAQQRELEADFGKFSYVNNALMGAIPGHPLFKDLVELLGLHMKSLPPDVPAAYLTGPHYLTTVLQAHPTVEIFPARQFYPYTATERWRRHEPFPEAYAVHHWTLSDVAVMRMKRRQLGDEGQPCLTVAVHPACGGDTLRLRWVLEGLCLQSVTDFEVLVVAEEDAEGIGSLCREFEGRLLIRCLPVIGSGANGGAPARNSALAEAQASRVLFLDSDCLPDPDVVETHARYADRALCLFGYRRIYPKGKMFPFRDAVDHAGLIQHSHPERGDLHIVPSAKRWKDVASCCFSVPTALAARQGGFGEDQAEGEVRALAKRLSEVGCPTVPCIYGARVTQLGPDASASRRNAPLDQQQVKLRFNHGIARVRARGAAPAHVPNGKSPWVLRVATLNGAKDQQISALFYHLLREFETAQTPSDAVASVTQRVAVEPAKLQRVTALCANYIHQAMAGGVLVPTSDPGENPNGREFVAGTHGITGSTPEEAGAGIASKSTRFEVPPSGAGVGLMAAVS